MFCEYSTNIKLLKSFEKEEILNKAFELYGKDNMKIYYAPHNENNNENNNIFNSFNEEEKYVTYKVYRVLDTDNIDKIMEKYNVTKEELMNYNNIEDLHPGDKLIIPTNEK